MEWVTSLRMAIDYMEEHLLDDISAGDVADVVHMSPFYLQKGFKVITGYSIGEYIRYRRLYLAALDLVSDKEKIIDLAYKYGYDTPESFTKAFGRFHGASPMQVKKTSSNIKLFLPLKVSLSIQGGDAMDCVVEKLSKFVVIGFEREFSMEDSYQEIPKFWAEFRERYLQPLCKKEEPENLLEQTICECRIGEYGVCVDDLGKNGMFRYLIAGPYNGGEVPEGMTLYEFPDMLWAKFGCSGAMPEALQYVNTKIFKEWLPGNAEYDMAMGANIEWYSEGDIHASNYESAIWIPVKRK